MTQWCWTSGASAAPSTSPSRRRHDVGEEAGRRERARELRHPLLERTVLDGTGERVDLAVDPPAQEGEQSVAPVLGGQEVEQLVGEPVVGLREEPSARSVSAKQVAGRPPDARGSRSSTSPSSTSTPR
jgi:hypothetical protein